MKKMFVLVFTVLFSGALMAQPIFNVGIKAGINNSKITVNTEEFNSESVVKSHVGVFGRLGWSKIYLQPEVYYSAKGGKVFARNVAAIDRALQFDFSTVDVPLLLGIKVLEGSAANFRIMGGPVFSIMTNKELDAEDLLSSEYYEDHYFGYQYGAGVDFLSFFLDARMEHSGNRFYNQPGVGIKNNRTFMITLGFKIL